jgi:RNA polymerase sigma factor (sigma-70 family)
MGNKLLAHGPYGRLARDAKGWPCVQLTEDGQSLLVKFLEEHGQRAYEAFRKVYPKTNQNCVELGYTDDDINAACLLGMVTAMTRFDPERNVLFKTYAIICMRAAVQSSLLGLEHVGGGRSQQWQMQKMRRVTVQCDSGETDDLLNLTGDDPGCDATDIGDEIDKAMRFITPRQAEILRLRFWDGKTLAEVGELIGISKERVRQVETDAIQNMRKALMV